MYNTNVQHSFSSALLVVVFFTLAHARPPSKPRGPLGLHIGMPTPPRLRPDGGSQCKKVIGDDVHSRAAVALAHEATSPSPGFPSAMSLSRSRSRRHCSLAVRNSSWQPPTRMSWTRRTISGTLANVFLTLFHKPPAMAITFRVMVSLVGGGGFDNLIPSVLGRD